ncbi:hypothetical protein [Roseomonas xinghualingensis]|uniref:hypothetical protein n=1 Tax=Roseomonas xinghualingensis TaxID=2986475 RepID=UPI0021F1C29B|nr:hypothetical protein [Roseomonas sp. SXEYE001]MCV4209972.1 hypothetical protein [Roseomonas sp. SXEYE001]
MSEQASLTALEFCRLLARQYQDKPDDHTLSIGDWDYPEPDPAKMTIYTLPRFGADISITVGELRKMAMGGEG